MDNRYYAHTVRVNVEYVEKLLADVPEEQLAEQPHGLVNHPLWCIGHLAVTADMMAGQFGASPVLPPEFAVTFGPGSGAPTADRARYPSRAALLKGLRDSHENFLAAVLASDDAKLSAPVEGWNHPWFPNKGALAQMIILHDSVHVGQISAWRRLKGYPPLF